MTEEIKQQKRKKALLRYRPHFQQCQKNRKSRQLLQSLKRWLSIVTFYLI